MAYCLTEGGFREDRGLKSYGRSPLWEPQFITPWPRVKAQRSAPPETLWRFWSKDPSCIPRPYLISSRECQPHSRALRTLWLRGILSLCWHWRLPRILIWEIRNVLRRHCAHLHLLPAYQTWAGGSKPSLCAFLETIIVLLFVSSKSSYVLLKPSWSHWAWQRGHWYLNQYNQLLSCLTSTFIIDLVPY